MIFKEKDFSYLETNEGGIKKEYRLHKPTGVYFLLVANLPFILEENFIMFEIGSIDKDGVFVSVKVFSDKNQETFFEAVKYFESLIEKKQPQPEQEDPSVGIFVFLKNEGKTPNPDSFADVFGNKIIIDKDDVEKVFSPPVNKKYGRLNMYAVEEQKYDAIKGKFALKFDQQITDLIAEKTGRLPRLGVEPTVFAYKMTPYETSENEGEGGEGETPKGVNDDDLSIEEIEGEDPEEMTGENSTEPEGNEGEGEPEGNEGKEEEEGEGEGEPEGNEGEGEPEGNEGEGEPEGNKGKEEEGEGEPEGNEGEGEPEGNEGEEPNNGGEGQAKSNEGEEDPEGEEKEGEIKLNTDKVKAFIENKLDIDDLVAYFKKPERIEKYFTNFTQDELEKEFYRPLKVRAGTNKSDFLKQMNILTEKYFK
jgi:hypothetical protein